MPLLIGVLLALAVGGFATATALDRDRAFYPVVTIVVASYYALFAVMGGSTPVLLQEVAVGVGFAAFAVLGFKGSLWLTAGALAGHGAFDLVHAEVIANPGVPAWWPAWCAGYDVAAGAYLAWLIRSGRVRARG